MKTPRIFIMILLLSVGLMLIYSYTQKQAAEHKKTTEKDSPTSRPETQPDTQPDEAESQSPTDTTADTAADTTADTTDGTPPAHTIKWHENYSTSDENVTVGSLGSKDGYLMELQISPRGAGIVSAKLTDEFMTAAEKQLWDKDPAEYEKLRQADPDKYEGHYSVLNSVNREGKRLLPYATGKLKVYLGDSKEPTLEPNLSEVCWRLAENQPVITDEGQSVSFVYGIDRSIDGVRRGILRITKTYTVRKKDYSIGMTLAFENLSGEKLRVSLDQFGPTGLHREDTRGDSRQVVYAWLDPEKEKVNVSVVKKSSGKMLWIFGSDMLSLDDRQYTSHESDSDEPMLWIAATNKFFGSIMYIEPTGKGELNSPDWKAKFYYAEIEEWKDSRTFRTGVEIPKLELAAGSAAKRMDFDIYIGPKKQSIFEDSNDKYFREEYKDLRYVGVIDFGGCCGWCTFSWLTLIMMWLLRLFSSVVHNWGVAIILLVIIVRVILHPLTKKSQVSMMKMQKLAPQLQKLKEKYADDREALQKEMMKFYKEQGASPLLGCLPMLIQMPIWIALWTGISASFELRHAAFLPFWLTDLAAPDALISWGRDVAIIGPSFNLLPLLMAVGMYLQTKLNPSMAGAAATPEQQKQQKIMKVMLPVVFTVFLYQAPSGVTLYIMASMFGSVLEQYVIRKHIQEKEAETAAAETTVKMPGKASRDNRPKKPKGPFWMKRG